MTKKERHNYRKELEKLLAIGRLKHDNDCADIRGGICDCLRYAYLDGGASERKRKASETEQGSLFLIEGKVIGGSSPPKKRGYSLFREPGNESGG